MLYCLLVVVDLGKYPKSFRGDSALDDVRTICAVLNCLGIKVDASEPHVLNIDSTEITSCEAPYELAMKHISCHGSIVGS